MLTRIKYFRQLKTCNNLYDYFLSKMEWKFRSVDMALTHHQSDPAIIDAETIRIAKIAKKQENSKQIKECYDYDFVEVDLNQSRRNIASTKKKF